MNSRKTDFEGFWKNFFSSSPDRYRQIPEASLKDREDEQLDEAQLESGVKIPSWSLIDGYFSPQVYPGN